ncbi:hypothetical protein T03_10118 [Trichinella britovi]|uniref:Uncharacterized protein n=1 Tax=Trichinella britovi TaxID=45882 RepID=A0A0V1AMY7_TRIBR|nr:hypothetical protein T03_10118 [Trichinella britovi]
MNDTICDKQRHTRTPRKRLYVHVNKERNDVNMTHHVAQSKRNTIKTQLMT